MSHLIHFPVFCTVDVSWKLLTTFLLQSHDPFFQGLHEVTNSVILRSHPLSSITAATPVPGHGKIPKSLSSPFPNWTPQQCHDFLAANAPATQIHSHTFVVIDSRSAEEVDEDGDETVEVLKTLRSTFRSSVIALVSWDIGNGEIDEDADDAEHHIGGIRMLEPKLHRARDLADGVFTERVLRSGTVVRDRRLSILGVWGDR